MRALIVAIHGIDSTNQTSFVDAFMAYCAQIDSGLEVLTHEYITGPFPLLNNWFLNGHLARDIYQQILKTKGTRPVYLVAHSNGTVIARRVALLLAAYGVRVAGMILVAGAIDPDIKRNGLAAIFQEQKLAWANAYCSHEDDVVRGDPDADRGWWQKMRDRIWGLFMWPYGSLGTVGWQEDDRAITNRPGFSTYWFDCEHGGYFEGEQRNHTFHQILDDIYSQ